MIQKEANDSNVITLPNLRLDFLDFVFIDEHPDDFVDVDVDRLAVGIVAILVLKTDLLDDAVQELPMLRVGLGRKEEGLIITCHASLQEVESVSPKFLSNDKRDQF